MTYEFGRQIQQEDLVIPRLKKIVKSVCNHSCFSLTGFCEISHPENREDKGEAVIVDCFNHEVSTKPIVDIQYKERLAILCWDNDDSYQGSRLFASLFQRRFIKITLWKIIP